MKTTGFKKVLGYILTTLAVYAGFETSADIAVSLSAMIIAVFVITEVGRSLNFSSDGLRILSWLSGPVLGMSLWYLDIGMFVGLEWYAGLFAGFAASLSANFVHSSEIISALFEFIWSTFIKRK